MLCVAWHVVLYQPSTGCWSHQSAIWVTFGQAHLCARPCREGGFEALKTVILDPPARCEFVVELSWLDGVGTQLNLYKAIWGLNLLEKHDSHLHRCHCRPLSAQWRRTLLANKTVAAHNPQSMEATV